MPEKNFGDPFIPPIPENEEAKEFKSSVRERIAPTGWVSERNLAHEIGLLTNNSDSMKILKKALHKVSQGLLAENFVGQWGYYSTGEKAGKSDTGNARYFSPALVEVLRKLCRQGEEGLGNL